MRRSVNVIIIILTVAVLAIWMISHYRLVRFHWATDDVVLFEFNATDGEFGFGGMQVYAGYFSLLGLAMLFAIPPALSVWRRLRRRRGASFEVVAIQPRSGDRE
jgi:hypothetical protein